MSEMDREFWNDSYKQDPDQTVVPDHILDEELVGLPVGTALDLGCGSGPNVLKLAARGWSVVGIDWAEQAVELATRAAQEQGLDATFYVGDITTWEPPAQYDLVISTYALPGGEDSKRTLQTALKALAPGGTLLVAEWDKSMSAVWGFAEEELMSPEQIAALLPGLEIEQAEVRRLENVFAADDDPRALSDSSANVAFVRARRT
jgi:2-polyprenyl-3-methyl-5-hydroxy-6-metoxy-1,4-benzoquinol methylase